MPRQSLKKVDVPFRANSLTFHTNLISLVWVLLQELKELFTVLMPKDHPYTSATIESMLWGTMTVTATWTIGSSQISTVDQQLEG